MAITIKGTRDTARMVKARLGPPPPRHTWGICSDPFDPNVWRIWAAPYAPLGQ